jgi:hypothetical protein
VFCALAAVIALAAASSHFSGAQDVDGAQETPQNPACVGCDDDAGMTWIPRTGDPEVDEAIARVARERIRQNLRAKRDLERLQRLEEVKVWRGTEALISTKAQVTDVSRPYFEVAVNAFNADQASPAERRSLFAPYFDESSEIQCVGWTAAVVAVEPNEHGFEVTVNVRPKLFRGTGARFTPQLSVETWQLTEDGTLRFVKAIDNRKRGVRI